MKENVATIRLLLVDDEREFLASAAKALQRRGLEVTTAADGKTALELAQEQEFDAAVVDMKMPGIDGVEVFRRIKRMRPRLPVMILTGHGSIPQAFEMSREGVFDYIPKPCEISELVKKINFAVKSSEENAEGESASPSAPLDIDIKVLLVDDEEELLMSLTPVLERRRMEVIAASSGEEAMGILREKPVDVVVLDVKMPGIDGIETLKRIRRRYENLEVILLTGHPNVGNALEGVKLGARDYLVKPPDVASLTEKIREAYHFLQEKLEKQREETVRDVLGQYPSD